MKINEPLETKQLLHFINGNFCRSANNETFEDINPATGHLIGQVALGSAKEVDQAVQAAKEAFEKGPWAQMSIQERCSVLHRLGDLILEHKDLLAQAESIDTGKPIKESSEGDIPRAAQNFHFFSAYAASQVEECYTVNSQERHFAIREPLGVAGLITPWNLPLYLATWKIAPCLAMGNSCVLKPAEWTPLTATLFAHIVKEAGVPEGVFNIVHGFGSNGAGEALTRHKDVRCISFTGETTTGKNIMTAAAGTLKKLSFELGGKGATIIFADANLEEAIPTAVRAAYRNQGEICLAGSRLFVQESIYEKVCQEVARQARQIKVGDPLDAKTQMGAIISQEQLDKVCNYLSIASQDGKILAGGQRLAEMPSGNFLSPAVVVDIDNNSRVCQEEIFGPVLPVIPFRTKEEAIAMVNSTAYGLSASVWSENANVLHAVSSKIKSGIVWANCWFARDLRTPFGGQKASGIGREGGRWALEFFSEYKTVCYRYF